jgi:surfactin synthase thioesterase subunit
MSTLFCLPYAGGDEFAYWRWPDLLAGIATVHAIGRDTDLSVEAVTDRVAGTTGPFAIYGHSMGARLGFEVVRELRRRGAPLPQRLYVGGAHPPHLREPIARVAHLDVGGFIDQLILRADTPAAVRDDPDVREALVPALAADLAWLQAYRFRPGPPLPVPVVAFAATHDNEVPGDLMLGWARHTAAWFRHHTLAADHLFVAAQAPRVTALIAADLLAAQGRVAPPGSVSSRSEVTGTAPPGDDELHVWRVDRVFDDDPDHDKALRLVLDRYAGPTGARAVVAGSGGTALVAVGPAVRGAAVERVRPIDDLDAFCARLGPHERTAVLSEPEEDQARLALLAWATREARRSAAVCGAAGFSGAVRQLDLESAVAAVATVEGSGPLRLRYETVSGDAR